MKIDDVAQIFAQSLATSELSAKQQAVLHASLQLFADKGFDATSTSDIAQAAGVSEGTVYQHFKTKEAILRAILVPFVDQVIPTVAGEFAEVMQTAATGTTATFIHALLVDRLTFATRNYALIKIFVSEALRRPELLQTASARLQELFTTKMAPLLTEYQARGELRAMPPAQVAEYLLGTILATAAPALLTNRPLDIDATATAATKFLLQGLGPEQQKISHH